MCTAGCRALLLLLMLMMRVLVLHMCTGARGWLLLRRSAQLGTCMHTHNKISCG